MKVRPRFMLFFTAFFCSLTIHNIIIAQTISCSNPSVTYNMITANAKSGGSPTNWGSFGTTPFAWESGGTCSLNTNATSISSHSGVPNRTNVFYGGTNNTPADIISNQIFNLYRGPITLTGTFLNLSTNSKYDESFISIIPSVYSNRNPVGRAGLGGSSPVGISVGGIVGGTLRVYDNQSDAASSTTLASYSGVMPASNTWYTLSATFDIQGGNIVITDIRINGSTISGFTTPLVVLSSYYSTPSPYDSHQWVNSIRAVASVDDLLDDFTITTNACYNISGTVFNDADGLNNATVDGTGINNPGGSTLTAQLVDENEVIVDKTTIAAGGSYSFTNVPGGIFEVRLTNRAVGAIGTDASASSLPDGWIYTGEHIGAGAGNDGSPNGSIVVGTTGATNVNFGIQTLAASDYTFDCSSNVFTFDMVPSNAKISNQADQTATGTNNPTTWSSVVNNFEWESFATDANVYGNASTIPEHTNLSGVNDPTNVFFGGVWQNATSHNTGQVTSDFISKKTFSLNTTSGPITLIGRFLNKSAEEEENESYLILLPQNYTHFSPMGRYNPSTWTRLQREGVYVGGNITTGLYIVDNLDDMTDQSIKGSIAAGWGGLAPSPDTWYTISATFDIQGSNLVVTNVSINGTTASFSYPVVIGTTASHAWLSNCRVGASVDDLMDDFTIARNPCITGNVYYDANAMSDGMVNGIGTGSASGSQLYTILVNGSGNVVQSVAVASDGSYTMSNVYPGNYSVRLCTTAGIIGNPAPASSLPVNWIYTGENIGTGPGSDGTSNGIMLSVAPTTGTRLTGINPILSGSTGVYIKFGIRVGALPVKLVKFTAERQDKIVVLNWITASETDNDHFVIERSGDGLNWETISQVPTKGNGNNLQYYQYEDLSPLKGLNFYRLRQVDIDEKSTFSQTVKVNMDKSRNGINVSVYPNPVLSGQINLFISNIEKPGIVEIALYDMTGSKLKVWRNPVSTGENRFSLSNLNGFPKGVYNLLLNDADGHIIGSTRFVN